MELPLRDARRPGVVSFSHPWVVAGDEEDGPPPVRDIGDLPGPRGLPLRGNLHQIRVSKLHLILEGWARRYGPMYRLRAGGQLGVVVSDPDLAAEVLRRRPDEFRRLAVVERDARELGFHGVFTAEGQQWRPQRRLAVTALNMGHLNRRYGVIRRACERLCGRLEREAAAGEPVDLLGVLTCFTVDVTSELAFGVDMNTLGQSDGELQGHLARVFEAAGRRGMVPVPYWRWLKLPADRAVERSVAYLERTVGVFIEQARARLAASPQLREAPTDFLEAMLVAEEEGGFTDAEVSGNVFTLLLAGEDTTANTMAWALWLLSTRAGAQERWAAEAAERRGEGRSPASPEAVAQLAFGDAVLREAMRLKPPAPLMPHETVTETVLGGVRLPAGTGVTVLPRTIGLAVGEDFDPDRWLGEDEGDRPDQRSFLAFGAGPRFCPGRNLAFLEAKAAMATIARSFELAPPATEDLVTERFGFVMKPHGLRVRLRRRSRPPGPDRESAFLSPGAVGCPVRRSRA